MFICRNTLQCDPELNVVLKNIYENNAKTAFIKEFLGGITFQIYVAYCGGIEDTDVIPALIISSLDLQTNWPH